MCKEQLFGKKTQTKFYSFLFQPIAVICKCFLKIVAVKKNLLTFEPDFSFTLIAVISPLRGYRISYEVEQKLKIPLYRDEDLGLFSTKKIQSWFQVFAFRDEENYRDYFLLANKNSGTFLIPEQKSVDYYLKIEGDMTEKEIKEWLQQLKEIKNVQHCFEVNANELRSKQNLLL